MKLFDDDLSYLIGYKVIDDSTHILDEYENQNNIHNICHINLTNLYNDALNKIFDMEIPDGQNIYDLSKAFIDM